MLSENITGNHTQALFLLQRINYLVFRSCSVLETINVTAVTYLGRAVPAQSLCSKDNNILEELQMAEEKFVHPHMLCWCFLSTYGSKF